jgi:hypothetical protein
MGTDKPAVDRAELEAIGEGVEVLRKRSAAGGLDFIAFQLARAEHQVFLELKKAGAEVVLFRPRT